MNKAPSALGEPAIDAADELLDLCENGKLVATVKEGRWAIRLDIQFWRADAGGGNIAHPFT